VGGLGPAARLRRRPSAAQVTLFEPLAHDAGPVVRLAPGPAQTALAAAGLLALKLLRLDEDGPTEAPGLVAAAGPTRRGSPPRRRRPRRPPTPNHLLFSVFICVHLWLKERPQMNADSAEGFGVVSCAEIRGEREARRWLLVGVHDHHSLPRSPAFICVHLRLKTCRAPLTVSGRVALAIRSLPGWRRASSFARLRAAVVRHPRHPLAGIGEVERRVPPPDLVQHDADPVLAARA
jgi:hypothetical protein